jgi:membrane-associated phospholipid phosphatase
MAAAAAVRRYWHQAPDGSGYHRPQAEAIVAATGLTVATVCAILVANKIFARPDAVVFRWVNHWPGWLYPPMWVIQLAGAIGAVPLLAAVTGLLRMLRLAVGLAAAAILKVYLESLVKAFVQRDRPAQTLPDVIVRHGAAAHGLGFPSGHAMVIFAIAALVAPYLTGRWKIPLWVLATAVCVSRLYLGAHFPLDVVAGAGLGLFIGAALNLILGVPYRNSSELP